MMDGGSREERKNENRCRLQKQVKLIKGQVYLAQGDQIGRIFALWVIAYLEIFFKVLK
jgi:hypothetical protein